MQLLALLRDTRMRTGQYGWGWHSENKSTFTDKPILLDLGLVKLNLSKNMYSSPLDFASDVRLVFENAMLYNPKTDAVHGMAHQLLFYFEMLFRPIQAKLPTNQRGDEIELDIEALDTKTLWELDRFVTNWKKLVSKTKRQALLVNSAIIDIDDVEGMKKNKKEAGEEEEDVDIGDEMLESSFRHVEIEKDDGGGQGQAVGHGNENASSSSNG
ncbi:putative chromatin remodeler Bromodomain family [Helianthus annuus]|nr:putative chromatin remodeler Bromodomain family [Helianthus annuus]